MLMFLAVPVYALAPSPFPKEEVVKVDGRKFRVWSEEIDGRLVGKIEEIKPFNWRQFAINVGVYGFVAVSIMFFGAVLGFLFLKEWELFWRSGSISI